MSTSENIDTIKAGWQTIVGPDLAKRSQPIGVCEDALIIMTVSDAASQALSFLASRILAEVLKKNPDSEIRRLRLRRSVLQGA